MRNKITDFLQTLANTLATTQLKVGFIDGATYTDGTPVAMIAAINEYGNPPHQQPPRPFFRHAITEHSSSWADTLSRGLRAGMSPQHMLEQVGAQIQGEVQQSIATLLEPKLSSATLNRRRTRTVLRNQSTKPLVDTKVMIGDVNYKVTKLESASHR